MVPQTIRFAQSQPAPLLMEVEQQTDLSAKFTLDPFQMQASPQVFATCAAIEYLVARMRADNAAYPALCQKALSILLDCAEALCVLVHGGQTDDASVAMAFAQFEAAHLAAREQFSEYVQWLLDYAEYLHEQLTRTHPRAARRLDQRIEDLHDLIPSPGDIADLPRAFSLTSRLNAIVLPAEIILMEWEARR